MDDRPNPRTVLIVAVAGRALGVSARRAGYLPLVADCFGDRDTRAAARAHVHLKTGLIDGMDETEIMAALDALATGEQPEGVVWGTGFEDRPDLLAAIGRRFRLLGNAAQAVARLKDPEALAALCADHGIRHPEISLVRPAMPAEWLVKRRGGAGGLHVRPARADVSVRPDSYFQRRVGGVPVSVLVVGDGRRARIIGLSSQWSSPTPKNPFRYGGAVRPAGLAAGIQDALARAAGSIVAAAALVGLNSVDFLVDGDQFWLLEVNPRPGATLDIFEPGDGSLFALHVAACNGTLDALPCNLNAAAAAGIVYAGHDIAVPAFAWPDWTADRQSAGTAVKAGSPVCTVLAAAATANDARALVDRRVAKIVARAAAWAS
ncbi:MAG TPA: ATP-grasp domain-containing protein [Xanthobacteraceae bacterium]|nr:ATP-grasp domain-containing protein [Xanthobacteraceae bacterium]